MRSRVWRFQHQEFFHGPLLNPGGGAPQDKSVGRLRPASNKSTRRVVRQVLFAIERVKPADSQCQLISSTDKS